MEQERLIISDQEMIELKVELRDVQRDSEQVAGDFVYLGHGYLPTVCRQEVSRSGKALQQQGR
jgi:hypothetical protein